MPPLSWPVLVKSFADLDRNRGLIVHSALADTTLDAQLRQRVGELTSEFSSLSVLPHNPALVEPLLGDLATLLDRLLASQREASELEVRWVTYHLDAELSQDLAAIDQQLAVLAIGREVAEANRHAFSTAAAAFANVVGANSDMGAALASEATANEQTAENIVASSEKREQLIDDRSNRLTSYRAALEARHNQPGGAHNYLERFSRVMTLLIEDWDEAYRKARCIAVGMRSIFGASEEEVAFPDLTTGGQPGPIFRLVLWARRMMRLVELLGESELQWEVVLPLVQPIRQATHLMPAVHIPPPNVDPPVDNPQHFVTAAFSLINDVNLKMTIDGMEGTKAAVLNFKMPELFEGRHLRARVVGVGLSFVVADLADSKLVHYRITATLIPPPQIFNLGSSRQPAAIAFGNVWPFGPQMTTAYVEGLAVHNLRPKGAWTLLLHPYVASSSVSLQNLTTDAIRDIRVHLKIVSMPLPGPQGEISLLGRP
jgi:hypothetical protein